MVWVKWVRKKRLKTIENVRKRSKTCVKRSKIFEKLGEIFENIRRFRSIAAGAMVTPLKRRGGFTQQQVT